MLFGHDALATGLNSQHSHRRIVQEWVEQSDGVGSAADAGNEQVWQTILALKDLGTGLVSYDPVKIANHDRVGVGAIGRAQDVVGRTDVRHPVAHGLIDRLLEGLLAGLHRNHLGPEHLHAVDIQFLPLAVDRPHVDDTFHAKHGRDGGRCYAVLTGSGLGDDPSLAHALGQQYLAHGVVNFVGTGVQQIFPLQVDPCSAQSFRQALSEIQGCRPSHELLEIIIEFPLELWVLLGAPVFVLELLERVDESLWHVASSERPEMAGRVGHGR